MIAGQIMMATVFLAADVALWVNFPSAGTFWLLIAVAIVANTIHKIINRTEG
jgi:hypothetical protein